MIDLSIYEPLFWILGPQATVYDQLGIVQQRTGNRAPFTAPRNAYLSKDGALARPVRQLAVDRRARDAPGRPARDGRRAVVPEPRRAPGAPGRARRGDRRLDRRAHCRRGGRRSSRSRRRRSPPCSRYADIFEEPQFLARDTITTVEHPDLGPLQDAERDPAPRQDAGQHPLRRAAARRAATSRCFSDELGYTDEQIEELRRSRSDRRRRPDDRLTAEQRKEFTDGAASRRADGPGPKRDFVGYGRHVPKVTLAGRGPRVAIASSSTRRRARSTRRSPATGATRAWPRSPTRWTRSTATSRRSRSTSTARAPASGASSGCSTSSRSRSRSSAPRSRSSATPRSPRGCKEAGHEPCSPRLALGGGVDALARGGAEHMRRGHRVDREDLRRPAARAGTAATARRSTRASCSSRRAASSTTPTPTTTTCPTTPR